MTKTNVQSSNDPMSNRPDYIQTENIEMPVQDQVRFPRLKLLQALSPEVTKGNEKYNKELEVGNLIMVSETTTVQIDGEKGIVVVPLSIRKRYVEYTPREQGGGFVASYDSKEEMEAGRDPGNDIQPTIEFLCIEAGAEEPTPFVITFDSVSKQVTAGRWAGFINQYKTLVGVKYLITAKQQLNKKKQAYYNFNVQPIGWVDQVQKQLADTLTGTMEPLFLEHAGAKEESEI